MAPNYEFTDIWKVILLFSLSSVCATHSIPFDFKQVTVATPESLEQHIQNPFVSVVYYYRRELPRLRAFFKELDKSAEYLEIYDTKTIVVDCNAAGDAVKKCQEPRVEYNVHTYKNGNILIRLELETMFDVNSIMSNILQLVLLNEVPIVQNHEERLQVEKKNMGKFDIIFAYHKAIGTFEHRVFMEVAYAYQGQYKFVITTEKRTLEGLMEKDAIVPSTEAALWVLYCRETAEDSSECSNIRYRGNLDLTSLAIFLKAISLPDIFDMPDHGHMPGCQKENINCIFLYYDSANKDQVQEVADALKYEVYGIAGIVIVDTENVDVTKLHGFDGTTPALSLKPERENLHLFMKTEWSFDNIAYFMQQNLFNKKTDMSFSGRESQQNKMSSPAPDGKQAELAGFNFPSVEEVETQDDQVAEAVFVLRSVPVKLNLVPALTDKTFHTTIQDRDLVSVLFYLPFDSRSKAFLRAYSDASFEFEKEAVSPLVRVNCYDWTDVCGAQNVTSYPVVRFFRKGYDPQDYYGTLHTDAVVATVKLLRLPSPMLLKTQQEAQQYVAGKLPENITASTNMSVLGLFQTEEQGLPAFQKAADTLHNITVFAYMKGDIAQNIAKQLGFETPCVLFFRHDDPFSDTKALTKDISAVSIYELVQKSRVPTLVELTEDIFPLVYQENKAVFILFCNNDLEDVTEPLKKIIGEIAASGVFSGVIFSWMHVSEGNVGLSVQSQYSATSNLPAISVVYHRKGEVYNYEGALTAVLITEWLQHVVKMEIVPSKMLPEGDWKPHGRGYDFLALSEYESKYGQSPLRHNEDQPESGHHVEDFGNSNDAMEVEHPEDFPMEKSTEDFDDETRGELLELRMSRLYHQVPERKRNEDQMHKSPDKTEKKEEVFDGYRPDNKPPEQEKMRPKHTEL